MNTSLPETWPLVKLGACLRRRKDTVLPSTLDDPIVGLVGLEDIQDGGRGGITVRPTKPSDIDSLKTRFQVGDILYGKLRPYLNKVGIAQSDGLCSTEIWAFTTEPFLDARFAAHYLASSFFVKRVESQTKGANLPRLDSESFNSISIPLPPLSEQQRIVDILQEAEEIRRLRAQAEAKTTELIPAMFREFFGEIGANSKQWPVVPVSKFVESFQAGKSLMGSDTELDESLPRVLKISAVTSGLLIPSESKALPATYEAPEEHRVREGDLLITRANTEELVGATALVWKDCPENLLLPDKIWRFEWKNDFDGTPEFVWALFQQTATRKAIGNIASGTGGSMKNISMAKLMQMRVIWPPKKLQELFSKALREILELSNDTTGVNMARSLTASLYANSFTGKLTKSWREEHETKLKAEAAKRDALMGNRTSLKPKKREIRSFTFAPHTIPGLNSEQHRLYNHIQRLRRPEQESEMDDRQLPVYFTARLLSERIGFLPFHHNQQLIEGHLAVLAARGVIIPVSQEEQHLETGEHVYGRAWRLARKERHDVVTDDAGNLVVDDWGNVDGRVVPGDWVKASELERLAQMMQGGGGTP